MRAQQQYLKDCLSKLKKYDKTVNFKRTVISLKVAQMYTGVISKDFMEEMKF